MHDYQTQHSTESSTHSVSGHSPPLIDFSEPRTTTTTTTTRHDNNRHIIDSGSGEDDYNDDDNISLGSLDTETEPNTLPPTYDLATILSGGTPPAFENGDTKSGALTSTTNDNNNSNNNNNTHQDGQTARVTDTTTRHQQQQRLPGNLPSMAEMENLPSEVVASVLETLSVLELYELHALSERWRPQATCALLEKFRQSHVVLWIDQESHRTFRPIFVFESFDEATNRIRWVIRPSSKPERRGQVYSKTFGTNRPTVRIISVGNVDKYDYLDKEAHFAIEKPGLRTMLGSDKGCPWALIYKVSTFTRKGKKIDGERWVEPLSFECHLNFLNPRRAHKMRLLWYLQKSYHAVSNVASASSASPSSSSSTATTTTAATTTAPGTNRVARTKIEGAITEAQMA
ncbi:hypothetical protein BGZ94_004108, partial [Podila epigama]